MSRKLNVRVVREFSAAYATRIQVGDAEAHMSMEKFAMLNLMAHIK